MDCPLKCKRKEDNGEEYFKPVYVGGTPYCQHQIYGRK